MQIKSALPSEGHKAIHAWFNEAANVCTCVCSVLTTEYVSTTTTNNTACTVYSVRITNYNRHSKGAMCVCSYSANF